ncbi:MAG: type II secretion system ATPase GspE [Nitrospirota bacterium]
MAVQRAKRKMLGELLLEAGVITQDQLSRALAEQQKKGGRLGDMLKKLGFITDEKMIEFLGNQLGISYMDVSRFSIDPAVVKLIPETTARRYRVIPISKAGKELVLAMVDPLDVFAIDEISNITGLDVQSVVSTEKDVMKAIDRYYKATESASVQEIYRGVRRGTAEEVKEAVVVPEAEDTPVVKLVNLIITQAAKENASDIHIELEEDSLRVRYRVDGVLHEAMSPPKEFHAGLVSRIKIMADLDIAEKRIPQDGRFPINTGRKEFDVRVSTLPTVFGEKVVMRLLEKTGGIKSLDELGFLPDTLSVFEKMIRRPYGFILVTGPTGSGKTTTLYSALSEINSMEKNIVTVEDPVEYEIKLINQVQINPKAGLTFASGLRSILRQDPDIMLVGEVRDSETANIAIHAALTGHLVFSTLHTNDSAGAVARLIDMGIEPFLISSSLLCVLSQRLIRRVCSSCRELYEPQPELLKQLGLENKVGVIFFNAKGCAECRDTGYSGRVGLYELLIITEAIRDLIVKKSSASVIKAEAVKKGFRTMREDGILKAMKGITTVEEVLRATQEVEE